MVDPNTLAFFKERILSTYALNHSQKEDVLASAQDLSLEQINGILDTVMQYEKLIATDSRNYQESSDRQEDIDSITQLLEEFPS